MTMTNAIIYKLQDGFVWCVINYPIVLGVAFLILVVVAIQQRFDERVRY